MLAGITITLLFQLLGEVIAYFTGGTVLGAVIGMALLANLGILFVPAGVGIVQHLDLLSNRGFALLTVILGSIVATLLVTVLVFISVKRLMGGAGHE